MRQARIETTHEDARRIADAVTPDNTDSMTTTVEGDSIVTVVERETTGGLQATVDDYVVNLTVAETVADNATRHINHE
ncbi:hypothetical protein SAMN04487949_1196 [Halogranum gelatinilyticum]|uniref:KEOPS complex subunit Pcc1 n=1 Tax=Halogranum gelatinilyticum TaxID=660521 RepID=A0A1G9R5M5_9EURY|nr:KEOPS complex subunit Pcc1 [Halogranum gelatinilyticum]SDM18606.1 hypothetical protein SAMN04487949_1196 [Halogranum gelatinilyticum]